jgi:hypothetical protein
MRLNTGVSMRDKTKTMGSRMEDDQVERVVMLAYRVAITKTKKQKVPDFPFTIETVLPYYVVVTIKGPYCKQILQGRDVGDPLSPVLGPRIYASGQITSSKRQTP